MCLQKSDEKGGGVSFDRSMGHKKNEEDWTMPTPYPAPRGPHALRKAFMVCLHSASLGPVRREHFSDNQTRTTLLRLMIPVKNFR